MNINNSNSDIDHTNAHHPVHIEAIGGSAGAMDAIKILLENLSPDTGMAYVYIQHISPDFPSNLAAILGRATKMQVLEATDLLRMEPNKV